MKSPAGISFSFIPIVFVISFGLSCASRWLPQLATVSTTAVNNALGPPAIVSVMHVSCRVSELITHCLQLLYHRNPLHGLNSRFKGGPEQKTVNQNQSVIALHLAFARG